jgi:hypothetical protein
MATNVKVQNDCSSASAAIYILKLSLAIAQSCCTVLTTSLMLRCQAQLELFYFLAGFVTVLRFGARDGSYYWFFGGLVVVVKEVLLQARLLYLQLLEMS